MVKHFEDARPGDLRWRIGVASLFAVSFLAGHLLGRVRESRGGPLPRQQAGRSAFWVGLLVPMLLTLLPGLLFYEAWALTDPARFTITYYVRCASIVAPVPTLATACIICGLMGHWFWPAPELRS